MPIPQGIQPRASRKTNPQPADSSMLFSQTTPRGNMVLRKFLKSFSFIFCFLVPTAEWTQAGTDNRIVYFFIFP
jgi:hypothetical protein